MMLSLSRPRVDRGARRYGLRASHQQAWLGSKYTLVGQKGIVWYKARYLGLRALRGEFRILCTIFNDRKHCVEASCHMFSPPTQHHSPKPPGFCVILLAYLLVGVNFAAQFMHVAHPERRAQRRSHRPTALTSTSMMSPNVCKRASTGSDALLLSSCTTGMPCSRMRHGGDECSCMV